MSKENQLFVSFRKPYKAISTSTIARWIKEILKRSGIDINEFKANSTQSAATSKVFLSGASVNDILKLANWSNEKTFSKYYKRSIVNVPLGELILS